MAAPGERVRLGLAGRAQKFGYGIGTPGGVGGVCGGVNERGSAAKPVCVIARALTATTTMTSRRATGLCLKDAEAGVHLPQGGRAHATIE
jgi:hypothetical protein